MHDSAWSNDLTVEVGGHGVVSHAGSAVLRLLADRTSLHTAHRTRAKNRYSSPRSTNLRMLRTWSVMWIG